MPELPEVETVVAGLREHGLCGRKIVGLDLHWPRTFGAEPEVVKQVLLGHVIVAVGRRAKFIIFDLDSGTRVLAHLRMTGKFMLASGETPVGPHDRVVFHLDDGRLLLFNDTRKFGRFYLCSEGNNPLERLGPEPLEAEFKLQPFAATLARRQRAIKPLLLDQSVVAGLGNIYVDEAFWQAKIHPERPAATLTAGEVKALHRAIRLVLADAVAHRGTTLGDGRTNFYSVAGRRGSHADHLNVFRRDGEPCPRCHTTISRSVVGQRGTHFCHNCQPPPGGHSPAGVPALAGSQKGPSGPTAHGCKRG